MATPPFQSSPFGLTPQQQAAGQTPSQILAGGVTPDPTAPQSDPQTSGGSAPSSPPGTNLSPGAHGQDVEALQKYLVDQGYLTPEQMGTGPGNYGPQTTAAVAALQKTLGVDNAGGVGSYGPKTQAALTTKYQNALSQLNKSGGNVDQAGAAKMAVQNATNSQQPTDPVMGAMMNSMAPIMQSLTQVLNNINNPMLTGMSLQDEYNQLAQANNLPGMQTDMLNMSRIMTGTEDDIRDEITKGGGGATESQVLAMSAARNKVIMKQYNTVATQYQAAQTNVSNMMQYATTDQATQLQRQTAVAGITESMASIETQMMQMGVTMNQHATDNLNKVVTNVGYTGLAAQAQDNPQMLSSYENLLGLAQGSLSNPTSLNQLETLRQQTVAQGAQKVNIQMYNAGLSTGTGTTNTPGGYVTPPGGKPAIVATNSTGKDSQGRSYTFDATQAQNLLKSGATIDPGTNNIVVPGIGYYVAQPGGSYALSIDPASEEGKFIQYRNRAQNPQPWQPQGSLSNQRMTRNSLTRQTNAAISQYVDSPLYQNVSAATTYFSKLNAGLKNPGSIGDPDIIDSLVKINTGGQGAITEQQYSAYSQGQTWSDKFQVVEGKVVAKGGTLSPDQRTGIRNLAQDTFDNYRGQYENMYVQAMQNLDNQGIPDAFWGNMPEWTSLMSGTVYTPLATE